MKYAKLLLLAILTLFACELQYTVEERTVCPSTPQGVSAQPFVGNVSVFYRVRRCVKAQVKVYDQNQPTLRDIPDKPEPVDPQSLESALGTSHIEVK